MSDLKHLSYFLYDPLGNGFELFNTIEERDKAFKECIDYYNDDGWDEEVENITAGIITHTAQQIDRVNRPPENEINEEGYDKEDDYWEPNWTYKCSYGLKEI